MSGLIAVVGLNVGSAAATESDVSPSAHPICPIWRGGDYDDHVHYGELICDYGFTDVYWPSGQWQTFVIGKDYAVWNILQYPDGSWSGWRSLGGAARSGVTFYRHTSVEGELEVLGTDLNPWCRYLPRLGGPWNPWTRC
jgi:hypothetical protein